MSDDINKKDFLKALGMMPGVHGVKECRVCGKLPDIYVERPVAGELWRVARCDCGDLVRQYFEIVVRDVPGDLGNAKAVIKMEALVAVAKRWNALQKEIPIRVSSVKICG